MKNLTHGASCKVIGGVHKGKSGIVSDIKKGKTGHISLSVTPISGIKFKTLAKNILIIPK